MEAWLERLADPEAEGCLAIEIGGGASGSVYLLAKDGEAVVAKWHAAKECAERQFLREVECLSAVRHPNVVEMLGWGRLRGRGVVFLELMNGGDLFDWIVCEEPNERQARGVLRQLAAAVTAIHAAGVVHRDVKVENVLLAEYSRRPIVKLADFGMGLRASEDGSTGADPCGSMEYCAPEVLACEAYDERVDVWSYGVLAFAVLTGRNAFGSIADDGVRALAERIASARISWRSGDAASPAARAFVELCATRDPKARPSAAEVADAEWLRSDD